jgi:phage recombination protein Bet
MNQLSVYENKGVGQNITPLFDNKKLDLLKNTICKGSNDEEFELFLHACQRTGLDPFMRQIYAVKRKQKQPDGSYTESMTIQTGIDGYRLIAERTAKYSPGREPTYQYDQEGKLLSATAYIKKQTADGSWHEVAATAFFCEYVQTYFDKKINKFVPTQFWQKMGHTMIAKCAEALALRKAFPGDLSGLYTKEEMMQSDIEDITNQVKVDTNTVQQIPVDHIAQSNDMIENTSKQDEPKKYISKSQIKMFNDKYEMINDKQTRDMIDQAVIGLEIEGFPSIEKMQEKDWIRFMKSFDKHLEKKKVS